MKRLLSLLIGMVLVFTCGFSAAAVGGEEDVQTAFERMLDLWRSESYGELYALTIGGKTTREAFSRRLAESALRPTCCWDKLQEVSITMHTSSKATLRGTVTLESPVGNETKTKAFKLTKERGEWRIAQGELLSLAGGAGKKKSKRFAKSRQ